MIFVPLKNMTATRIVVPQVRGASGKSLVFEPAGTEGSVQQIPQSALGHPALSPYLRSVPPKLVAQVEVAPVPVKKAVPVPAPVKVPAPIPAPVVSPPMPVEPVPVAPPPPAPEPEPEPEPEPVPEPLPEPVSEDAYSTPEPASNEKLGKKKKKH